MTLGLAEKISFLELAKRVLEKVGKPMTAGEIWQYAEQTGIASLLQSTGKTPEASLGSRLYTDVQKPTSVFVKLGSRPAKFLLKSLAGSIPDLEQQVAAPPSALVVQKTYAERELHSLLVWFADSNFGAHCRTIFHEKSLKKGEKQKPMDSSRRRRVLPDDAGLDPRGGAARTEHRRSRRSALLV